MTIDSDGNMYVLDWNYLLQKFSPSGSFISQVAAPSATEFFRDAVFDGTSHILLKIDAMWSHSSFSSVGNAYSMTGGNYGPKYFKIPLSDLNDRSLLLNPTANTTALLWPDASAIDSHGNIFVVDSGHSVIKKFNANGEYQSQFGGVGTANGKFTNPAGIAIDGADNIYVADTWNNRVQKFDSSGTFVSKTSGGSGKAFSYPTSIAINHTSGDVYVADLLRNRIQRFDAALAYQSVVGAGPGTGSGNGQFFNVYGVALDSSGNIYATDLANKRVQIFNSSGVYQSQFGTSGTGDGQFAAPTGITISGGHIYVVDRDNHRVQKFSLAGVYQSQFGSNGSTNGKFSSPQGITADADGNLYISDTGNSRIQKFNSTTEQFVLE